jgi:uncharacterized protein (UPF0332 family)
VTRIRQLLTLAQDELDTANLLWQNDRCRACISRSYYAMYHAAQAILATQNLTTKTHRGVIQLFGQYFIKTDKLPIELARAISDAYDLRQLSDYEETILLTNEQAKTILSSAQLFVREACLYCEQHRAEESQ